MIKSNFELFLKDNDTVGVVAKSPFIWRRLQRAYQTFPEDAKFNEGDEVLVKVPLSDQRRLKMLLGLPTANTFDLARVLSEVGT